MTAIDALSLSTVYAEIGVLLSTGRSISSSDHHLLSRTHMNRDLVTLKAFLHHLPNTSHRLGLIKNAYDLAHKHGLERGTYLSDKNLNTFVRVCNIAVDIKEKHPEANAGAVVYFAMMANDADRDMVEQIIIERTPESVAEVQSILEKMKAGSPSLSPGTL